MNGNHFIQIIWSFGIDQPNYDWSLQTMIYFEYRAMLRYYYGLIDISACWSRHTDIWSLLIRSFRCRFVLNQKSRTVSISVRAENVAHSSVCLINRLVVQDLYIRLVCCYYTFYQYNIVATQVVSL